MAHTEQLFEKFETYEEPLWFHSELLFEMKVDKLTFSEKEEDITKEENNFPQ